MNFKYNLHLNDLLNETSLKNATTIAIDAEFSGLNPLTDKLHLIQICDGTEFVHFIRFKDSYNAPNLKEILENENILKIFHFGRSDLSFFKKHLNINVKNIFDTKMQTSDWGVDKYTEQQIKYAANDVLHLHKIKNKLEIILKREKKHLLAEKCFEFLDTRTDLDLNGLDDIFEH